MVLCCLWLGVLLLLLPYTGDLRVIQAREAYLATSSYGKTFIIMTPVAGVAAAAATLACLLTVSWPPLLSCFYYNAHSSSACISFLQMLLPQVMKRIACHSSLAGCSHQPSSVGVAPCLALSLSAQVLLLSVQFEPWCLTCAGCHALPALAACCRHEGGVDALQRLVVDWRGQGSGCQRTPCVLREPGAGRGAENAALGGRRRR